MKKIAALLIVICSCIEGFTQQSFFYTINAKLLVDQKPTILYIAYEIAGNKFKDSLALDKPSNILKKTLSQPVAATISTNNKNIVPITVILANNSIQVSIANNSIATNNYKFQNAFLYLTANDRVRPSYFPLSGELSAKNDITGLNKLAVIFDSLKKDDVKKSIKYFKANSKSLLSLFAFNRYTTFYADYSKGAKDFSLLPTWAQKSPDGISIFAKIAGAKSVQVNTLAKQFVQLSATAQPISLQAFKGKYILLDFWASWCAPCRKEHPNLIKTYQLFKDKNFEIISVSLDSEKDDWLNAIAKDNITWIQISDLKGQLNDIAIKYGIQSVPANFLINSNGVIIDKNISGDALVAG
jgi:thiol-disulfide isomerase/thioredoxin